MKIYRSITEPIRANLTWSDKWQSEDSGLIACWESGREKGLKNIAAAEKAITGELIVLPWKGGVERKSKQKEKFGTLKYLAMWQGLRGEDLIIDTEQEISITCSLHSMTVIFTNDSTKYSEP